MSRSAGGEEGHLVAIAYIAQKTHRFAMSMSTGRAQCGHVHVVPALGKPHGGLSAPCVSTAIRLSRTGNSGSTAQVPGQSGCQASIDTQPRAAKCRSPCVPYNCSIKRFVTLLFVFFLFCYTYRLPDFLAPLGLLPLLGVLGIL
jgi:hypothetical protein